MPTSPISQERILSYTLATVLKDSDLEQVSGGGSGVLTIRSQRFVGTRGGDTSIAFDNYDYA